MDAERYKDQLREAKYVITKLEFKAEKLADRLEVLRDELNQVRRQLPDGLYILNDFYSIYENIFDSMHLNNILLGKINPVKTSEQIFNLPDK